MNLQNPPSSSGTPRTLSVDVPATRRRVSHQAQSTRKAAERVRPPTTDIYSHPAAVAYAAAHPNRAIPLFGPYLVLHTLGEGEFGKVKLGLHTQFGHEVAVKLIRRSTVDNHAKMSKIEREVRILDMLRHPNIVRLYDVVETDKFFGIVLQYASGGELFDHILAHRHLKERDASKFFSQLISGVWYIHQKKIVHRDLKLENLLLDRNRNLVITDFGFANRFDNLGDNLMETMCGSPCYAAPELVNSDGLYVGTAVDIWSCGVILYAMLAGYLPFDDDPANPDGENVNALYQYIARTPLTIPDHISEEASSLLRAMLVPDPRARANLDTVMRHPWLAMHAMELAGFGLTVAELEASAADPGERSRAYQRWVKGDMDMDSRSRKTRQRGSQRGSQRHARSSASSESEGDDGDSFAREIARQQLKGSVGSPRKYKGADLGAGEKGKEREKADKFSHAIEIERRERERPSSSHTPSKNRAAPTTATTPLHVLYNGAVAGSETMSVFRDSSKSERPRQGRRASPVPGRTKSPLRPPIPMEAFEKSAMMDSKRRARTEGEQNVDPVWIEPVPVPRRYSRCPSNIWSRHR
ncbi:kinase-like domain-containing protein [Mycena rebaudengoi]|nr:kinase-like domain-containing protein [Mycena rebaudengoi]